MKYVVIEYFGSEVPIVFPEFMRHDFFVELKPIAAGFCQFYIQPGAHRSIIAANVYGESTGLKLKSRSQDAELIEQSFYYRI